MATIYPFAKPSTANSMWSITYGKLQTDGMFFSTNSNAYSCYAYYTPSVVTITPNTNIRFGISYFNGATGTVRFGVNGFYAEGNITGTGMYNISGFRTSTTGTIYVYYKSSSGASSACVINQVYLE